MESDNEKILLRDKEIEPSNEVLEKLPIAIKYWNSEH